MTTEELQILNTYNTCYNVKAKIDLSNSEFVDHDAMEECSKVIKILFSSKKFINFFLYFYFLEYY